MAGLNESLASASTRSTGWSKAMTMEVFEVTLSVATSLEMSRAATGGEMPAAADAIDRFDEELPDLAGEVLELVIGQAAQVARTLDAIENLGQAGFPPGSNQ